MSSAGREFNFKHTKFFITSTSSYGFGKSQMTFGGLDTRNEDLYLPDVTEVNGYTIDREIRLGPDTQQFPSVRRIHIPAYYKSIITNNAAFPNLESIEVEEGSCFRAFGTMLATSDGTLLYVFSAGLKNTVTLPEEITSIADSAFANTKCTEVIAKNPNISVNERAFRGSAMYKQNKNIAIGNVWIDSVRQADELVIPDNIRTFHESCFRMVDYIGHLVTPVPIPKNCFYLPEKRIKSITIKKPDRRLDFNLWRQLIGLNAFDVGENPYYTSIDGVLFSKDRKKLVFYPAGRLETEYTIPDGTEIIGLNAFEGALFLESVIMPPTVRRISQAAFYNCQKLKSVTMSDAITDIPGTTELSHIGVFENCFALEKVYFSKKIKTIGSCAFLNCEQFECIIPEGVEFIGEYAFATYRSVSHSAAEPLISRESCTLPASLLYIGKGAIAGFRHVTAHEGSARGLICAIEATSILDKTTSALKMFWRAADISMISDGGIIHKIIIPEALSIEARKHLDMAWNQDEFDWDEYALCIEGISDVSDKQAITFELYKRDANPTYEAYLRRVAPKLAEQFICNHNEGDLVTLIKWNFMSPAQLKKILKAANDANMTVAAAYLMEATNAAKKTKSTLRI